MDRQGRNRRKQIIIIIKNVVFPTQRDIPKYTAVGWQWGGWGPTVSNRKGGRFPVHRSDVGRLTGTRGPSERTEKRRRKRRPWRSEAEEWYAWQVRIPVGQECRAGTTGVGSSSVTSRNEPRLISPAESLTACRGSQKAETGRRSGICFRAVSHGRGIFRVRRPSALPLTHTHAPPPSPCFCIVSSLLLRVSKGGRRHGILAVNAQTNTGVMSLRYFYRNKWCHLVLVYSAAAMVIVVLVLGGEGGHSIDNFFLSLKFGFIDSFIQYRLIYQSEYSNNISCKTFIRMDIIGETRRFFLLNWATIKGHFINILYSNSEKRGLVNDREYQCFVFWKPNDFF